MISLFDKGEAAPDKDPPCERDSRWQSEHYSSVDTCVNRVFCLLLLWDSQSTSVNVYMCAQGRYNEGEYRPDNIEGAVTCIDLKDMNEELSPVSTASADNRSYCPCVQHRTQRGAPAFLSAAVNTQATSAYI